MGFGGFRWVSAGFGLFPWVSGCLGGFRAVCGGGGGSVAIPVTVRPLPLPPFSAGSGGFEAVGGLFWSSGVFPAEFRPTLHISVHYGGCLVSA